MTSDLDRLLRAVRTLAKIAHEYDNEHLLDVLGEYATVKQEDDVAFVGTWLSDISEELHKRNVVDGYEQSYPHCRQCGKEIDDVRYDDSGRGPRADAQYCGQGCRQAAYRDRVAAKTAKPKRKRNGKRISLRLEREKREQAVTIERLLENGVDPSIILRMNIGFNGSDHRADDGDDDTKAPPELGVGPGGKVATTIRPRDGRRKADARGIARRGFKNPVAQ